MQPPQSLPNIFDERNKAQSKCQITIDYLLDLNHEEYIYWPKAKLNIQEDTKHTTTTTIPSQTIDMQHWFGCWKTYTLHTNRLICP